MAPASKWPVVVVIAVACLYTIVFSTLAIRAHDGLQTQMNDLGNMDQAIWAASHGQWSMPQSNDVDGVIRSRIAVHANFVFWAIAPLYRIRSDPRLLLVLASLACAAAGLALFLLARRWLGPGWIAMIPPLAFWANPAVHDGNLYDFHIVVVATAIVLWMFWAFEVGRARLGWVLLVLALSCQENLALVIACYGVYAILTGHRARGIVAIVVSLAYLSLLVALIVPALNHGQTMAKLSGPDCRYKWLTYSSAATILEMVSRPDRLRVPLYLLVCGGIVALPAWRVLLLALPGVLSVLLTAQAFMTRITGTYYFTLEIATVILAAIVAAGRPGTRPRRVSFRVAYLAGAAAVTTVLLSPLPYALGASMANYRVTAERAAFERVCAHIPADAALVVQNNLGAHLAHRAEISSYPRRVETARWALFQLRYLGGPASGLFVRTDPIVMFGTDVEQSIGRVVSMLDSAEWQPVAYEDGFYLFERGGPATLKSKVRPILARDAAQLRADFAAANAARWRAADWLDGAVAWTDLHSIEGGNR